MSGRELENKDNSGWDMDFLVGVVQIRIVDFGIG